jgi:hypothetical protein
VGNDPAPPHHSEPEDAQTELPADEVSWDDPSRVTPADATFNGRSPQAQLHDAYLGNKAVHSLLKQLGIDPMAAK